MRAVVLICLLASVAAQAAPRMTQQQVIAAARPALEARFPGARSHRLVAHEITDGFWTVFYVHPGEPDRPKRGEPFAHVRDSDGKVVVLSVVP
jgi:hypothetical protein